MPAIDRQAEDMPAKGRQKKDEDHYMTGQEFKFYSENNEVMLKNFTRVRSKTRFASDKSELGG